MAVPIRKQETDNVITLSIIDGKLGVKPEVRYNKDGSIDRRHPNKVAGESSEVYPFTSEEEIKAMIDVFNKHIDEAQTENQRMIACRNKMLFLVGVNSSLRASDLVSLKWDFFYDSNGEFKDVNSLQPKKTKKSKKFVRVYFNDAAKKAIANYVQEYPVLDLNGYLFKSRKGDGAITEKALWKIVVDVSAEAGITKNVGSHSLRKTFGYWAWHNAKDKNKALVVLQQLFNHSSTQTTLRYIGLMNYEIEDMFNNVNIGLDFI
jgi:integrase